MQSSRRSRPDANTKTFAANRSKGAIAAMSMFRYRDQEAKNIAKASAEVRKRAKVDASLARRKAGRSLANVESLQADIEALADRVTSLEVIVASLAERAASSAG